jgi:hypothetical protein
MNKPVCCCMCSEHERIAHLFFECVVARAIWKYVVEFLGFEIGSDYMSIAAKWLQKEKYYVVNTITAVALRGIWLTRNDMIFQRQVWSDVKVVLRKMLWLSVEWKILCKKSREVEMMRWLSFLEWKIKEPLLITNMFQASGDQSVGCVDEGQYQD